MDEAHETVDEVEAEVPSRRRLLKVAAAGVGGAGLAVLGRSGVASATDGQPVLAGQSNDATATTTVTSASNGIITLYGKSTGFAGVGVQGETTAADTGVGVLGVAIGGVGVWGASGANGTGVVAVGDAAGVHASGGAAGVIGNAALVTGADFKATGSGLIRMVNTQTAPPTTGEYERGDLLCSDDGSGTWVCVASGEPGVWRKLAGSSTAGALHPITPQRVYDSRAAEGPLGSGASRTVSVADGVSDTGTVITPDLVPAGATAVALNVTVTQTVGAGYLTVWPAGPTMPLSSAINWFGDGQNLANGLTMAISDERTLQVHCSAGASTQLVIDVGGYYL
jgi:hypothetical protein